MTTVDACGNKHRGAGSPGGGRFTGRVNAAPTGSLTVSPTGGERAEAARHILNRSAPEGASTGQRAVWEEVRSGLADQLHQQPVSYVAFQAHQRAESARLFAARHGRAPSSVAELRAQYADELADELYAAAGKFRYPQRDPRHVGDGDRDGESVEQDALASATSTVHPVGLTQTRAAVRNRARGGGPRRVVLSWDSVPATSSGEPLQVIAPADGTPLILDVQSGCPRMSIVSGHAVIIDNGSGYGIDVADGAHATVISGSGRKTSITARAGATVDFYPSTDSRGYQHIEDNAAFRLHGRADKITLSSDRSDT